MVRKGGGPLTKPRPIRMALSKREIKNFAGMSLTQELAKWILRGPLKFIGLIPLLNYNVIEQRVWKGGAPLAKPRPIGMARSKRAIKNFSGMSLTMELTKGILRGSLKFLGLIPVLNYTVI